MDFNAWQLLTAWEIARAVNEVFREFSPHQYPILILNLKIPDGSSLFQPSPFRFAKITLLQAAMTATSLRTSERFSWRRRIR